MTEQQYMAELQEAENIRRRLVGEMMGKPFDKRVMSVDLESELDAAECKLLDCPPVVCHTDDGEAIYGGKGLLEDTPDDLAKVKDIPPLSIQVIPQSEWPVYIEGKGGEDQLTMEPYIKHILNQAQVGSCAAEATAGCTMAVENMSGQTPTKLNAYFLYHWSSGGSDRGSTLSANVALSKERGCASEEVWPRSRGFRRSPSDEARQDAKQHRGIKVERARNWEEFGTALLMPFPVQFGYTGHSIWGCRLISPERLDYANSWGYGFGDNGIGTLHKRRIEWGYGAYIFMSASENRQ